MGCQEVGEDGNEHDAHEYDQGYARAYGHGSPAPEAHFAFQLLCCLLAQLRVGEAGFLGGCATATAGPLG